MLWCQVCNHGGHYKEMIDWFKVHPTCPAGCQHSCFQMKGRKIIPADPRVSYGQQVMIGARSSNRIDA